MKTKKIHDSRTALRLPYGQREKIDQIVNEGKYESLSHVVRAALTEFLEKQEAEKNDAVDECVY